MFWDRILYHYLMFFPKSNLRFLEIWSSTVIYDICQYAINNNRPLDSCVVSKISLISLTSWKMTIVSYESSRSKIFWIYVLINLYTNTREMWVDTKYIYELNSLITIMITRVCVVESWFCTSFLFLAYLTKILMSNSQYIYSTLNGSSLFNLYSLEFRGISLYNKL